jgi:hypothetical protein
MELSKAFQRNILQGNKMNMKDKRHKMGKKGNKGKNKERNEDRMLKVTAGGGARRKLQEILFFDFIKSFLNRNIILNTFLTDPGCRFTFARITI